jgi:hypothetical protein
MSLLSDAYVNEHHHHQLHEARNNIHTSILPSQHSMKQGRRTRGWQFGASLRQIRIQVTFEVASGQTEPQLECC